MRSIWNCILLFVLIMLIMAPHLPATEPNLPQKGDDENLSGSYSITLKKIVLIDDSFCFECFVNVTPKSRKPLILILPFIPAAGSTWHLQPNRWNAVWCSGKLSSVMGGVLFIIPQNPQKNLQFVASKVRVSCERYKDESEEKPVLCLDFPTFVGLSKRYAEDSGLCFPVLDEIIIESELAITSAVPAPEKLSTHSCEIRGIDGFEKEAVIITFETSISIWIWFLVGFGLATFFALLTTNKEIKSSKRRLYLFLSIASFIILTIIILWTEKRLSEKAYKSVLLAIECSCAGVAGAVFLRALGEYFRPLIYSFIDVTSED